MFVHARIAGVVLCVATSTYAAETQRWQVVNANEVKVGHALVTRMLSESSVLDSENVEIRFGKSGRRARYHLHFESESAPDGSLRRILREVETGEGHSRVEAIVVGEDLDVSHGSGHAKTTLRIAGAARDLKSDEWARDWLAAVGRSETRDSLRYRSWDAAKLESVTIELSALARGSRRQCRAARVLVARRDGLAPARGRGRQRGARNHGAGSVRAHTLRCHGAGGAPTMKSSITLRRYCRSRPIASRRAT